MPNTPATGSHDEAVRRLKRLVERTDGNPIPSLELQTEVNAVLFDMGERDEVIVKEDVNGRPVNDDGEVIERAEAEKLAAEKAKAELDDWEAEKDRLRDEADETARKAVEAEKARRSELDRAAALADAKAQLEVEAVRRIENDKTYGDPEGPNSTTEGEDARSPKPEASTKAADDAKTTPASEPQAPVDPASK